MNEQLNTFHIAFKSIYLYSVCEKHFMMVELVAITIAAYIVQNLETLPASAINHESSPSLPSSLALPLGH